jgi:hypothetical protein
VAHNGWITPWKAIKDLALFEEIVRIRPEMGEPGSFARIVHEGLLYQVKRSIERLESFELLSQKNWFTL